MGVRVPSPALLYLKGRDEMKKKYRDRDAQRKNEWRQKQYKKFNIVMIPRKMDETKAVEYYLRTHPEEKI